MINKLLSLLRQKRFFATTEANNKNLIVMIAEITDLFSRYIKTVVWKTNDPTVIQLLTLIYEDCRKTPTIYHNPDFLEIVISKYDILTETLQTPELNEISAFLTKFLFDFNRMETYGNDTPIR